MYREELLNWYVEYHICQRKHLDLDLPLIAIFNLVSFDKRNGFHGRICSYWGLIHWMIDEQ